MKTKNKIILLILAVVFCSNCGFLQLYDCSEDLITQTTSPDNKYSVSVIIRDCGATTNFITEVNFEVIKKHFWERSSEKETIVDIEGTPTIELSWVKENIIKIHCGDCKDEKKRDFEYNLERKQ